MNILTISGGDMALNLDEVSHAETKRSDGVLVMELEMESSGTYVHVTGHEARKAYRALFGSRAPLPKRGAGLWPSVLSRRRMQEAK